MTMFRHDTRRLAVLDRPGDAAGDRDLCSRRGADPVDPANTDQITWGVTIYGVGTLTTDDYSMYDATAPATGTACTGGAALHPGRLAGAAASTHRSAAIHAVLLNNGKVLLVAGSGNDPDAFAAGTFTSAVYDPATGTFTKHPDARRPVLLRARPARRTARC